jgi:ABC-type transport system involved in cytochrome bd biosynthesis fused ATPase/permease subunit
LTGSLRENLDPFSQYDDATLNSALRASGLFSLQTDDEDGRLTLDSQIASGGGNLSVGQRQILALARAIVHGSKLLILDEGAHVSLPFLVFTLVDSIFQQRLLLVGTSRLSFGAMVLLT